MKGLWQYPEWEEGDLLREAIEIRVINVARYHHHWTVRVSGKDGNACRSVRTGLEITKATDYKSKGSIISQTIYEQHNSTCATRKERSDA